MKKILLATIVGLLAAGAWAAPDRRVVHWRDGGAAGAPLALRAPEGTSRWHLEDWTGASAVEIAWTRSADGTVRRESVRGETVETTTYAGLDDPRDATSWAFPDADPQAYEASVPTVRRLLVTSGARSETWRIETRRVGVGWVHLPSGPREVFLQRAVIDVRDEDGEPLRTEQRHRWVDARAGVVAEARGVLDAGAGAIALTGAGYADEVVEGHGTLVMYIDEIEPSPGDRILYGWDRGPGADVSQLTPEMYATIGDLIAASSWDFSANTTGTEQASLNYALTSTETCNIGLCGYPAGSNWVLGRRDVDFDGADPIINNETKERTDDPGTGQPTLWLRGARQKEGLAGGFGTGETGTCYTAGRPAVPLWDFPHQDANGWYFQAGDTFTSDPFQCDQVLLNKVCGGGQAFDTLYAQPCSDHLGNQRVEVIKEGVVTLPSGHTLNSLLASNIADFCVYWGDTCGFLSKLDEVRTVVYIWQVPNIGSVVLLQSEQDVADPTTWSTLDNTLIAFGLFPPVSIQVDAQTDSSVTISWNPGNDTHRIKDYVVYWDTDSGATNTYAFNSLTHPGQVSFNGTEATISGLAAGTQHFFTVTSRSDYTSPVSSNVDTFESILYPTQVSGDPSFVYPVEVQATTDAACATSEVQGVFANKLAPPDVEFCWTAINSPCLEGYTVRGADTPESELNYSVLADVGLVTCWSGNPTETYFIVTGRGGGANWPWGHYGI